MHLPDYNMTTEGEVNDQRRAAGRWRLITFLLLLICIALLIGLIVVLITSNNRNSDDSTAHKHMADDIDLSEPEEPGVFHDLTTKEIDGLMQFLYSKKSLNLEEMPSSLNSSFMYVAEVYVPKKTDVLRFLDNSGPRPAREAIVSIMRGDVKDQYVGQYVVGPLPAPTYMKPAPGHPEKVPYKYRPLSGIELGTMYAWLNELLDSKIRFIMVESFGGSTFNCDDKCLMYMPAPVSSALTGSQNRMNWLRLQQFVDTFILHPVELSVLVAETRSGFEIESISYNDKLFSSLQELIQAYNNGGVGKVRIPFPVDNDDLFSKMATRGEAFQNEFKRDPIQVEPDGKRYSVKHRHVQYMGWDFDFRMSTAFGPQVFDVRFRDERIAYEIGLQDISVMYSGHHTPTMLTDYFDSCGLIGPMGKGLVPGVDCPVGATFMDSSHVLEGSRDPVTYKNVFCLFEWNTAMPLRRHLSYARNYKSYYEGCPSNVMVLRTAVTVINYDYIFDFVFYQNGVIEVKAASTGYVIAVPHTDAERQYGFQIHDRINANLHIHLFNFKVDLDIKGTNNRFATLDISPTEEVNRLINDPNVKYHQTKFQTNVKRTETEGTYQFNFDNPKYLIFYNEEEKNKYGVSKSYRLLHQGMVKQLIPEGKGNEPSASWSRYQMATTKHKDTERQSSSFYSFMNADNPVVNFQSFIDDNESILDEVYFLCFLCVIAKHFSTCVCSSFKALLLLPNCIYHYF